jgi:hypothetical protein
MADISDDHLSDTDGRGDHGLIPNPNDEPMCTGCVATTGSSYARGAPPVSCGGGGRVAPALLAAHRGYGTGDWLTPHASAATAARPAGMRVHTGAGSATAIPQGHAPGAALPTGPLEHAPHLVATSRADRLGNRSQGEGERGYGHGREPPPSRAASGRRPQGVEGAPRIAVLTKRPGPPHPAQERFAPAALRGGCPSRYGSLRPGVLDGLDSGREGVATVAWAPGSA